MSHGNFLFHILNYPVYILINVIVCFIVAVPSSLLAFCFFTGKVRCFIAHNPCNK